MGLDSFLELCNTLFGWAFYGGLWGVLVATGIVCLPLLRRSFEARRGGLTAWVRGLIT